MIGLSEDSDEDAKRYFKYGPWQKRLFDDSVGVETYRQSANKEIELRTENGHAIDEAESSELLIAPNGSTAFTRIDENIAKVAGIPEGEVQANVGVIKHAEIRHGEQIRKAGYKDAQSFMLDVLNNWNEIREGTNGSLWLIMPHDNKHIGISAIQLHRTTPGVYRVSTLIFTRNRTLNNKKLLYTGRPTPAPSSGSGTTLTHATSASTGMSTFKGGLSQKQSFN